MKVGMIIKSHVQKILNFLRSSISASEASPFRVGLMGERSEPVKRGSGGAAPDGVQGQSPWAGGAAPRKIFEKSKQFGPSESNSSTKIHFDLLNN